MFLNSKHRYKEKKICIFTNYRTGSSFLNQRIGFINGTKTFGEMFSYYQVKNNLESFDEHLSHLNSNSKFVLKLMADHLSYDKDKLEQVLTSCDKIVYLYRKDFKAQAMSYIAASITNTYSITGLKENLQNHRIITVPQVPQQQIDSYVDVLKNNYLSMSYFFNKIPGELICLEDFEIKKPYQKTISWIGEVPEIPEFDVEALFNSQNSK